MPPISELRTVMWSCSGLTPATSRLSRMLVRARLRVLLVRLRRASQSQRISSGLQVWSTALNAILTAMKLGLAQSIHDAILLSLGLVIAIFVVVAFLKEIALRSHKEEKEHMRPPETLSR